MKPLHLTFDDGPDPDGTPPVLDLLERLDAPATFFVVAERAKQHPEILSRIVGNGHAVGNHSLDHRYYPFFAGPAAMRAWVQASELSLAEQLGHPTVGFRPPAGVRTPDLNRALRDLGLPLVKWDVRFYDAVWRLTTARAVTSLSRTRAGAIVLLHDRQRPRHRATFLNSLEQYIKMARVMGFEFAVLPQR